MSLRAFLEIAGAVTVSYGIVWAAYAVGREVRRASAAVARRFGAAAPTVRLVRRPFDWERDDPWERAR